MRLEDANRRFNEIAGIRFGELFSPSQLEYIIINKGKTGQLLEMALGLHLSSTNLDFDDGELKTNKCDSFGRPLETVFVTQISGIIDELINEVPFNQTHLCEKISNILYVPVCKEGAPETWMFLPSIHVNTFERQFSSLLSVWENDYYSICRQLRYHIEHSPDGYIHTSNGTHLQIRSKDAQPYHAIYSDTYGRYVSNKNHAFYFQKQFVHDIHRLAGY
jgi:DNA mismatch repair protein MutH